MFVLPLPPIAAIPLAARNAAEAAGESFGYSVGLVVGFAFVLCVWGACAFLIYKACARRTAGWIVAGVLGGVVLLGGMGVVGYRFIQGFNQVRQRASDNGLLPQPAGPVPGRKMPYTVTLPGGWVKMPALAEFDRAFHQGDLYFGVIAEEGDLGGPEVIEDLARKRLTSRAPDVEFGPATDEQIDGRRWRKYTARCHLGALAFAYQMHVYSGAEGTYQLVGWTSQAKYDADADRMQALAATFRFPPAGASGAGTAPSAGGSPTATAKGQTVEGHVLAYHLEAPADWEVKDLGNHFDVVLTHAELYVGVIADAGSMGTADHVRENVETEMKTVASDLQFSEPSTVKIDGRDWQEFTAKCMVEKIPFTYQYHVYAGPEGTFRLIGWTLQNLYDRNAAALRDVAASFRFPAGGAAGTPEAAASPAAPPQTLHGHTVDYQLAVPGDWKAKGPGAVFDVLASGTDAFVGVVAEPASRLRTAQASVDFVEKNLRRNGAKVEVGAATPVRIDGREWLRFSAKAEVSGLPLTYVYFAYGGPEGSYRIACWTFQNLFERREDALRQIALSFRFPPAAVAPTPAPTEASAPTVAPTSPKPKSTPMRRRR